jgi:hypothetical protein
MKDAGICLVKDIDVILLTAAHSQDPILFSNKMDRFMQSRQIIFAVCVFFSRWI